MTEVKCWAIVPAAGLGKRMGQSLPKQYASLNDEPVLTHTLRKLTQTNLFHQIILVAQAGDARAQAIASQFENVEVVAGGSERIVSVRNGLHALEASAQPQDWVFVHDGARPCVDPNDIIKLHQAIKSHPVGGILAVPAHDTLKQASDQHITKTIDRSVIWQAQTPQAFRYGMLKHVIDSAVENKLTLTDEAQGFELQGEQVLLVEGRRDNIKITRPEDIEMAAFILAREKEAICE